jgi:hypothetical protein
MINKWDQWYKITASRPSVSRLLFLIYCPMSHLTTSSHFSSLVKALACSNQIEIWSTLLIDLNELFIMWKVEATIDDLDLNWKVKGKERKYKEDLLELN